MTPDTCDNPVCNNDTQLCPGYMICEPVTGPEFTIIDSVVIALFTVELCFRIATVWAVDSRYD